CPFLVIVTDTRSPFVCFNLPLTGLPTHSLTHIHTHSPTLINGWLMLCSGHSSSSSSPSLADFSSVPQFLVTPFLENLCCTSLNSAADREPLSYVTLQEQHCVLRWFLSWGTAQREPFLSLNTLQVKDSPPNIFECQLRLWTQWSKSWSEKEGPDLCCLLLQRCSWDSRQGLRDPENTGGNSTN
uniref:Uncharacterized protein n=1 Tax=Salmo trutta TaxID=8032 RepID=A0A674B5P8_SALTR